MATADKLTYLNATKILLRDAIRRAGHYLPDSSAFRSYPYAMLPDEASLNLDFVRGEYIAHNWRDGTVSRAGLSNIMTTTRASGGGYFDHLGVYQWAANNAPRIDHDPATLSTSTTSATLASGSVTLAVTVAYPVGSYVRATYDGSNWMAGRVTASTGSSVTLWIDRVVGSGTYASWTVIRVRGLLVEGGGTNLLLNSETLATQSVTVTAVAHTLSFYGTGSVTLSGAATGTLTGTGASNRVSLTFTPSAGTLTLTVSGTVTSGQLEAGAFPTSYILTTDAQVTRAADQCVVSDLSDWYSAELQTIIARASSFRDQIGGVAAFIAAIHGAQTRLAVYRSHNAAFLHQAGMWVTDGAGAQAVDRTASPEQPTGSTFTVALSVDSVSARSARTGSATIDSVSASISSRPATSLSIGNRLEMIRPLNGHIESIQYIPRALSNTELQRITA